MQYLIENEKPSYKEPPKEICFYAYKKINHFKEILAQFQGKASRLVVKAKAHFQGPVMPNALCLAANNLA